MADDYKYLSASEKDHYDEYCRLRQLQDWDGFDDAQAARKKAAGTWINDRQAHLKDMAEGNVPGEPPGWDTNDRRKRYDFLETTSSGKPHNLCQLPTTDHFTDGEAVYVAEREVWWNIKTEVEAQEVRKQQNWDWLVDRRKYIWNLAEGNVEGEKPGWDVSNRKKRYNKLCVATKHGQPYEDWSDTHNDTTGEENKPPQDNSGTRHRLSEHFVIEEFDCNDGTKVPSKYYDALEYLCDVFLEPLRKEYGAVNINSGYRTPNYNASVGGASNSFHIYTAHDDDDPAADVSCASGNASSWYNFLDKIRQNKRGGNGGMGKYSTFVHVDLRDYASSWTG